MRGADAIVLCHDVSAPVSELETIRRELAVAGIERRSLVAATKVDDAAPGALQRLATAAGGLEVVEVSVLDDATLAAFREALWRLTGLVRVYLRHAGETDERPVALRPPATVADVADAIHHDLGARCTGARVWGPSARFDAQRVGRDHVVADGDVVEVIA